MRVRRHRLGVPAEQDEIIYEERDPGFFVHLGETQSGAFVEIVASDHETSEVHLLDRHDPSAAPRVVEPRTPQLRYSVEHHGDGLFILTNADGAEDFKLMTAPLRRAGQGSVARPRSLPPGVMILSHVALARYLLRLEREDAKPRIVLREIASGQETPIAFEEEAYSLGMSAGYEFDTDVIRYTYSSLTTPTEVVDYDLRTGARTLRKRQEVPSGHDPSDYVTRRIFATAADGEQVPVSLVHRKRGGARRIGALLLYGYGSYGSSMPASFRTNILSLVDRGFVYAIAHIRGGTEKGWRWYMEGKREKKLNTFTDFIACADALAEAGYTAKGRIVAHGGSAGGMLMGAVANLAPDLFAGIVAEVPFVDVLNTMLDKDLPLTPPEWPEWGNPGEDERGVPHDPFLFAVRQCAAPDLSGDPGARRAHRSPRHLLGAAKWVARLRAAMTGGGPVVLKVNMDAGHGGAAGRFDRLEEVALAYAFAIKAVEGF